MHAHSVFDDTIQPNTFTEQNRMCFAWHGEGPGIKPGSGHNDFVVETSLQRLSYGTFIFSHSYTPYTAKSNKIQQAYRYRIYSNKRPLRFCFLKLFSLCSKYEII